MKQPTVDVIIPAYNASRYIKETIESVVQQTYRPNKIIIVDDGSTDSTVEIVRKFNSDLIQLISVENGGVSKARNIGIRASTADYIAFLDADDIWLSEKLELQLQALKSTPNANVVYCGTSLINTHSVDIANSFAKPYINGDVFEDILFYERPILGSASSVMVARNILLQTPLFDETMQFSEDTDLWLHLSRLTEFTSIETPCVKIRVNHDSTTRTDRRQKAKRLSLQHYYYVNKFARNITLPIHTLNIHRRRILRLLFKRIIKLSEYKQFYMEIKSIAPFLCNQMGRNFFIFSYNLVKLLIKETIFRTRKNLKIIKRLKLLIAEGTVFFSHSKKYNADLEFQKRKK